MNGLMQSLGTFGDFLLVALGFGLIIVLHELGHFLAARWAGIRVMAFAVGFGPAMVSYRKGLGWRKGSSEQEYFGIAARRGEELGERLRADFSNATKLTPGLSPTEYRLNALPLGGYVKMLGQVDGDPSATSDAPDSYQNARVWKRMVVICAGVIANLIAAAALFILVFSVGLRVEPAVVGEVAPNSPASRAVADRGGPAEPGLRSGDEILEINGRRPNRFDYLTLEAAMTGPGESVVMRVNRPGVGELTFRVTPEVGKLSGLLETGVEPPRSLRIPEVRDPARLAEVAAEFEKIGLAGVKPGMSVTAANGKPVARASELNEIFRSSEGRAVDLDFVSDAGEHVRVSVQPQPQLQIGLVQRSKNAVTPIEHLLGLTGVMRVVDAAPEGPGPKAADQGLRTGDIFVRIGGVEFPSVAQGVTEIKSRAGRDVAVTVLREGDAGEWSEVTLDSVKVSRAGAVGFLVGDTSGARALVSSPPATLTSLPGTAGDRGEFSPAATRLITSPGTTVVRVDGREVATLAEVREALRAATATHAAKLRDAPVPTDVDIAVGVRRPRAGRLDAAAPVEDVVWTLTPADVTELHALAWEAPFNAGAFAMEETTLQATGPVDALRMGVEETRRVMLTTYLTFARLFQGTVKVEHLKGPVGIAHVGTLVAGRGFVWLLFFLALISVNLAVINFLPLPIVDGGQFLFLLYEQVRGRPAPLALQNALTIAGLVLIAGVFLLVTFNDVRALLGV